MPSIYLVTMSSMCAGGRNSSAFATAREAIIRAAMRCGYDISDDKSTKDITEAIRVSGSFLMLGNNGFAHITKIPMY